MNKLTIKITDDNKLSIKSQNPICFEDLLQITSTAVLGHAKQVMSTVPPEQEEKVKGWFYDLMNQAFSRTLEVFAPELELRPELTAQAILEAENQIIEKVYKEKVEGK